MAFLLPLAAPLLEGLALGGATALGAHAANKIIGDAPPDQMVDQSTANPQNQDQSWELVSSTPNRTQSQNLVMLPSGQFSNAVVPASSQNAMSSAQSANILGQSTSDGAALLANGQENLQQLRMLREGSLPQTISGAGHTVLSNLATMSPNTQMYYLPQYQHLLSAQGQSQNATDFTRQNTPLAINPNAVVAVSNVPGGQTSNVVAAPQPAFKTIDNQVALLPRNDVTSINPPAAGTTSNPTSLTNALGNVGREIGSGVLTGATGALSTIAANAGTQAMNLASNVVSRGASKVASNVQTAIGSLIKKIIGDAPPIGTEIAPWAAQMMGGNFILDPQVQKIVGDAMPQMMFRSQLPNPMSGGEVVKVVGDAPPMDSQPGMMTPAQVSAAQTNLTNSAIFQLTAKLILQEQIMETAAGLVLGLNVVQMNKVYGDLLSIVSGSFDQSATRIVNGIQGTAMVPLANVYFRVYADESGNALCIPEKVDSMDGNIVALLGFTCVTLAPAKVAPPLSGNTTLDSLRPLLLGAATTDYSSQLRVATSTTNVDAMMRAVSVASQQLNAQTGYSFSLPLIKALGYVLTFNPLLGENMASFTPGMNQSFTNSWVPSGQTNDDPNQSNGWVTPNTDFPFTPGASGWDSVIKIGVITERDYIMSLTSGANTVTWHELLQPQNWGTKCAVVFIPPGSHEDGGMNLIRMLVHMAYPIGFWGPGVQHYNWYANAYDAPSQTFRTRTYVSNNSQPQYAAVAYPKANLVDIPGPEDAVLFVMLGNFNASASMVTMISIGGDNVSFNPVDNPPQSPADFELGPGSTGARSNYGTKIRRFLPTGKGQALLLSWIREWEVFFGNNSDRSTALRFWADHSRLYGWSLKVANGVDVGSAQMVAGPTILYAQGSDPTPSVPWRPTTELPDLPMHLQHKRMGSSNTARYVILRSNTASGLLPDMTNMRTHPSGDPYFGFPTSDVCRPTVLSTNDVMIDYLVYKKWVYPNEEYPTLSLNDAARVSVTVALMSNMIASATDLAYQSNSMGITTMHVPASVQDVSTVDLRLRDMTWPMVEGIMNVGIQFPSSYNIRNTLYSSKINNVMANIYLVTYGEAIASGSAITQVSRIPRELMGQWVPSLMPIWNRLRLNIPAAKPSRAFLDTGNGLKSMFSVFVSTDDTGLGTLEQSILTSLYSRISQGVIALGVSRNVGFFNRNSRDAILRPIYFGFRNYAEYRDQLIVSAMGGTTTIIPAFVNVGLPKIENICDRDMISGFEPFRLLSLGPVDAYGPGEGSYSYIMYYNLSGGFSTLTTNSHATVPDSVFSGDPMVNLFNYM